MALTSDQITAQNFADFYQKILPYLNGGGMGMKLLWENSDPTQSFSAQTITLSSSDYDILLFVNFYATGAKRISGSDFICKGVDNFDLHVFNQWGTSPTGSMIGARINCSFVNDNQISITGAAVSSGATIVGSDNSKCIPYRIYGIKVYNRDVPGKTTLDYANAETISAMPYTATKDGVAFLQVGDGSNEGGRTFSVNGTAIAAFSTANNQAGKGTITIPLSSGDTVTSNAGVFGSYTFVPYSSL